MAKKSTTSMHDISIEDRAWQNYKTIEAKLDSLWAELKKTKDKDQSDKLLEIDKLTTKMFRAFDGWKHVTSNTVTVRQDEASQLILDALMSNIDALPDMEELSGLERYRLCKQKADDLYAAFKEWGVYVREIRIEAPTFCAGCQEELAA